MTRLITHPEARSLTQRLAREIGNGKTEEFKLLEEYVVQCNQTSKDLQNTIKAILDLFGPDGLQEVKKRVEAQRSIHIIRMQ